MQTAKHLLFVTNGPQQQVNALILARKLALVATQHGYKHSVISLDEFESSDHFDHVIIIDSNLKSKYFGQNALSLVSIEDIKDDADKALLTALEHSKPANEWEQNLSKLQIPQLILLPLLLAQLELPIHLWQLKRYNKVQKDLGIKSM